ncbi:MAG: dihydroorotase, partial [candidate division KSB1 bacterium]|nr:dihydroorotase [candidate division KSB1 bacterium]
MREQLTKSQSHRKTTEQNSLKIAAKVLLRKAHVIHGPNREEQSVDIFIQDGKIVDYQPHIVSSFTEDVIIFDLQGKLVFPGFLDLHVHFREPGREDEETLHSGAEAAMAGGFTAVCTMPNTQPVTDNREIIEFIHRAMKQHLVSVYPIAAISRGQKGEELVEMAELVEAGVVGFSDDGKSVANSLLLRRALEYSRMFGVPIIEHCEDANLAADGAMHEGFVSTNLGLPAIPAIAEDIVVARNIMLAEYTQGKMHIAHVSTAGAIELIRQAKAKGIHITAEATPH